MRLEINALQSKYSVARSSANAALLKSAQDKNRALQSQKAYEAALSAYRMASKQKKLTTDQSAGFEDEKALKFVTQSEELKKTLDAAYAQMLSDQKIAAASEKIAQKASSAFDSIKTILELKVDEATKVQNEIQTNVKILRTQQQKLANVVANRQKTLKSINESQVELNARQIELAKIKAKSATLQNEVKKAKKSLDTSIQVNNSNSLFVDATKVAQNSVQKSKTKLLSNKKILEDFARPKKSIVVQYLPLLGIGLGVEETLIIPVSAQVAESQAFFPFTTTTNVTVVFVFELNAGERHIH